MKQLFSIIILCSLYSCVNIKQGNTPISIDLTSDIVNPKHYIVTKANEKIIIDGKADEKAWRSAFFSEPFIDIEGIKKPSYDTRIKLLWDDSYLYVFSEMQEPHIWANLKQRDTIIYFNNDFEVFIDPSGSGRNYAEIEINALNTVWDLMLNKPYRVGGKAIFHWNLDDLKTAVHINGSINNHSDIDSSWSVEIAIPLKALIEVRNKPRQLPLEGEQWHINFSRVEWEYEIIDGSYQRKKIDGKYLRENNWVWSPQKVINMHEPEKWGVLQFTNEFSSKSVNYIEDKDKLSKQIAFALFRRTRYGSLKQLLDKPIGFTQNISIQISGKNPTKAIFYKTNFGFEYKIPSVESDQNFIINEEGVLKTIQ